MPELRVGLRVYERDIEFRLELDPDFVADASTAVMHQRGPGCEPELLHLLARVLRPGDLAFDIGANIGYFTLAMARLVGPTGKVVAYEPDCRNIDKLIRNTQLNRIGNVTAVNHPLWHDAGLIRFYPHWDSGASSLARSAVDYVEILATTLNHEFALGGIPKLIKLDTEGSEFAILSPDGTVYPNKVPYVVCELNSPALRRFGHSVEQLRQLMNGRDYSTYLLQQNGMLPIRIPIDTALNSKIENLNVVFSDDYWISRAWPEITI